MRVLHLFSNCKWTGPAEPALNTCVALRALGVEADFACGPYCGSSVNMVVETARARGIEPILDFYLDKHLDPIKNWRDRRTLGRLLDTAPYDLIHCHLANAHEIAVPIAARRKIPVIRTSYEGEGLEPSRRNARLLAGTALLIEPSHIALENDARNFSIPRERMTVIPGAVDTVRFDPARALPNGRERLGLPKEAFLLGIIARMQPHRHYEDLFAAMRQFVDEAPEAHLVVVGRGSKQERVGFAPVRALGLEAHVHFTGYIAGDDYVGMLRAFDAGIFLTPGSDGTCRAARELLAMGLPVVAADRGMLREMVAHEETGLVCDGTPEALLDAFRRLHERHAWREQLGRAAREKTVLENALEVQGAAVKALYERLLVS